MLKLISLSYTVMLNGYSQWLNIKGEKLFYRDISSVVSVILAFSHKHKDVIKQILKIYCLYVVCTSIRRLNVKLLQYKSIFKVSLKRRYALSRHVYVALHPCFKCILIAVNEHTLV